MKKIYKYALICLLSLIFFVTATTSISVKSVNADGSNLITTEDEFKEALHNAEENDVILVGDIDFSYSISPTGLTISKSVVIKSGKDDRAVFFDASFAVMGGVSEQDTLYIRFENIVFKGANDTESVTFEGTSIPEGVTAHHAIFFNRCVDADFKNCDFSGYVNGMALTNSLYQGGAIYGIYSSSDKGIYRLSLNFEDCSLYNNAGTMGGAIYLAGAGNIFLNMKNCNLYKNVSGFGGAIYASQATVTLKNCEITKNRFFDFSPDKETKGGGIYIQNGDLVMKNCRVTDNKAKNGGGVATYCTESVIDGCIISGNIAKSDGGGIYNENTGNNYVTIKNTTLAKNNASTDGAIFICENDPATGSGGIGKTFFIMTTLSGNTPAMKSYPKERFSPVCCAFYGEDYSPSQPNALNAYCHYVDGEHGGDPYKHMIGTFKIDMSVLKSITGNRFANLYGTFYVGDNASDEITYNFYSDGELKHSAKAYYADCPEFPTKIEKVGYDFVYWKLSDGTEYPSDCSLITGGGITSVDLYAEFSPKMFTVTYDYGDGRYTVAQMFDAKLNFPETPVKEGYTFVGWYTRPYGQGYKLSLDDIYASAGDVTYYAYFKAISHANGFLIALIIVMALVMIAGVIIVVKKYILGNNITNQEYPFAAEIPSEQNDSLDSSSYEALPNDEMPLPQILQQEENQSDDADEGNSQSNDTNSQTSVKIVKTRYTDEEIEMIVHATEETHLLTNRELEVFREILKGKKQGEIGYYLGISVHTVKDNAGRIYSKIGVSNKVELFEKIGENLRKS